MADRYIEVGGARLRFRETGHGPALVLIHGWTLDLDMWDMQAAGLAGSFRIIRMDRRGYGLSGGRPSLTDDVTDLTELLRALDVERFALLGMSQGARIALKMVDIDPQRIGALILDGPPFIDSPVLPQMPDIPFDRYRALAQAKGLEEFRREWRKNPLTQLRSHDRAAHELLERILDRYPGHDLAEANSTAAFAIDLRLIARRAVPTLIISGQYDLEARQQSAQWLTEHLAGAVRRQIPDAGHLSAMDNPAAYNQVVGDFLMRHAIGP
jgi:3-oxoadipate enol-lactonase